MAIKNSVSNHFISTFVDSINFFTYPGCSLLAHLMPLFCTDHESLDSPRIDNCKESAVFVENCKFSNPFCEVLRFSYETGKKQLRILAGFGWIRPEPPRYCAEFTTMCNSIFKNTAIRLRINNELVKNTPNAVRIGYELTVIRDDSRDFLPR